MAFAPNNKKDIFATIDKIIPPHKIEKKIVFSFKKEEAALGNKLFLAGCEDFGKILK